MDSGAGAPISSPEPSSRGGGGSAGDVIDRASGIAANRLARHLAGGGPSAAGGCETSPSTTDPHYSFLGPCTPSSRAVVRRWRPVQYGCTSEKAMELPGDRSGAASVVYNDALYVLGGYGGSGRLDDLFKFDFNTRLW